MIRKLAAAFVLVLAFGKTVCAHNLDEYLQASMISLARNEVQVSMRLIPGVAVFPAVLKSIDTNSDGIISASEREAYAARVLSDLSLTIDGAHLDPRIHAVYFDQLDQMKEGLGEITIEFTVHIPPGGTSRKLILENHHLSGISAYLVNCLVPEDTNIQLVAQNRNRTQSFYELDYHQPAGRVKTPVSLREER